MTPRVEIHGRDPAREAYRIETAEGRAFVPECLMAADSLRPGTRPSHRQAYEWIAAHRAPLARAVAQRRRGDTPRKPYDLVTLIDPASSSV